MSSYFKVRNRKIDAGRYELSYGKGQKKLVAGMWYNDLAGTWQLDKSSPGANVIAPSKRMRQVKEAWGAWAEKQYYSNGEDAAVASPTLPKRSGPPPFKRKDHPPRFEPKPSGPPRFYTKPKDDGRTAVDNEFACDPFDPAFHARGEDGKIRITPLGVLDEIYNWVIRHPHQAGFDRYPWSQVLMVLKRELPEKNYTDPKEKKVGKKAASCSPDGRDNT